MRKDKTKSKLKKTYLLEEKQVREIYELSNKIGVSYNEIVRHAIDYFYENYKPGFDIDYHKEEIKAEEILR